jgi:hypothetical protein
MSNIKKGALVKAWDGDLSEFTVGYYQYKAEKGLNPTHLVDATWWDNAIEIPPELTAQLDALGR